MGKVGKHGVGSVDTSGIVLEALCHFDRAVPLKDVAEFCAIPASKAHRYLTSLVRIGLASQDEESGFYDLGPMSFKLGIAAMQRDHAIKRANRALSALTQDLGTTGHVSIWSEGGPVVIRVEHGGTPIVTSLGLGAVVPLLRSSAGHIFLSHLPDMATQKHVERQRRQSGSLEETLPTLKARVRQDGFSRVDGTLVPGLSAVSGPIFHLDSSLACVITVIMTDSSSLADDAPAFRYFLSALRSENEAVIAHN